MSAGKGSKPRPCDAVRYRAGWERVWGQKNRAMWGCRTKPPPLTEDALFSAAAKADALFQGLSAHGSKERKTK